MRGDTREGRCLVTPGSPHRPRDPCLSNTHVSVYLQRERKSGGKVNPEKREEARLFVPSTCPPEGRTRMHAHMSARRWTDRSVCLCKRMHTTYTSRSVEVRLEIRYRNTRGGRTSVNLHTKQEDEEKTPFALSLCRLSLCLLT